jgi:hypothetical protein
MLFEGMKDSSSRMTCSASRSSAAAKWATPDTELCVMAPPSFSLVTSSCVTARITSGPVMNMYELSCAMTVKSVIAGE